MNYIGNSFLRTYLFRSGCYPDYFVMAMYGLASCYNKYTEYVRALPRVYFQRHQVLVGDAFTFASIVPGIKVKLQ